MPNKLARSRQQEPDVEGALAAFDRILTMTPEELRTEQSSSLTDRVKRLTRLLKQVQSQEELDDLLRQELTRKRRRSAP